MQYVSKIQNGNIEKTARWYLQHRETAPRPLVPFLKAKFGFTGLEAARALSLANQQIGGGNE